MTAPRTLTGFVDAPKRARALRAETDLAFARSVRFGFSSRRFALEARESLGVLDERVVASFDCGVGGVNGPLFHFAEDGGAHSPSWAVFALASLVAALKASTTAVLAFL